MRYAYRFVEGKTLTFIFAACNCDACFEHSEGDPRELDWFLHSVEDRDGTRSPTEDELRLAEPHLRSLKEEGDS